MPNEKFTRDDGITLREYVDHCVTSVKESIAIADKVMQERLAGMNEIREAMRDQATRFVTRNEIEIKLEAIEKQLAELEKSKNLLEGKASQSQVNTVQAIALVGILISIIGLIIHVLLSL